MKSKDQLIELESEMHNELKGKNNRVIAVWLFFHLGNILRVSEQPLKAIMFYKQAKQIAQQMKIQKTTMKLYKSKCVG